MPADDGPTKGALFRAVRPGARLHPARWGANWKKLRAAVGGRVRPTKRGFPSALLTPSRCEIVRRFVTAALDLVALLALVVVLVPLELEVAEVLVPLVLAVVLAPVNDHPVLFPESVMFAPDAARAAALTLRESLTSRNSIVRVPRGSSFHWTPGELERNDNSAPEAPRRVKVPTIVCVLPAGKVSVLAPLTVLVRWWKLVAPLRV